VSAPRRRVRALRRARDVLAGFGALAAAVLALGLALDVRDFDRTSGGYESPYTDVVGEPIDWRRADTTATGMVVRGRVVDVLVDCDDGMIRFEAFRLIVPFRPFSERAIVVHRPADACRERGFEPSF
jgi:hypothetical protein